MNATLSLPASNLPVQLTGFVGREAELADLQRLIGSSRLLTLTGAGGSGKTRLALELTRRMQQAGAEDIAWIELASLADAPLLASHLALALGLRVEGGGSAEQAVAAVLRERQLLLVLDNCEHLVEECARIVEMLLQRCPKLHVLATSRESLGISGERAWLVPALSLPGEQPDDAFDAAGTSEAVRLFVERAQDVLPSFALQPTNAAHIARICRRLDGLPLAIELAAARVAVLSPAQIAERLDDRFSLLQSHARSALPRHRTLRAAVDWSYELLSEQDRLLLERLSVFAGGFTLDAAEQICACAQIGQADVLDRIASLATRSLVAMQEEHGQARYRLLETIRDYAAARRAERGTADDVEGMHARYFCRLAEGLEHDIVLGRPAALRQMDTEHDNLRAALAWSADRHAGAEIGLPLCAAATWYWFHRQLWREGFGHFSRALATATDPAPAHRAAALHGLGIFGLYVAAPHSRERLEEAERIWRAIGDERRLTFTLVCRTVEASQRKDPTSARKLADEAVAVARATGDRWVLGIAIAHALVPVLIWEQQWTAVERHLEEAEHIHRDNAYAIGVAYALDARAFVALQLGKEQQAAALARASLRTDTQNESRWLTGRTLRILGALAFVRGDCERAAWLFGSAAGMYEAIGAHSLTEERRAINELPARIEAAMSAEAFAQAWQAGHRASFAQALAGALACADAYAATTADDVAARAGEAVAPAEPAAHSHRLEVRALGPLEIALDGAPMPAETLRSARPRELLLYLLSYPAGRTREQIGVDFWPDVSSAQVKNNFHVTLHHLRKALGEALAVEHEQGRYRIAATAAVEFDAQRFEQRVRSVLSGLRATRRDKRGSLTATQAGELADAMQLYRGPFLESEAFGEWSLQVREGLARLHEEALQLLAAHHESSGEHAVAAEWLRRLVAADTLHEEGARRLMRALAGIGRRHEALRVYQRLATALDAELGIEPEHETLRLADSIRNHDDD